MGRLSRFLHLERPRPGQGEPPAGAKDLGRFKALELELEPVDSARDRPGPHPEAGALVELEAPDPETPPFARCAYCGIDHVRHAEVCSRCGVALALPIHQEATLRAWQLQRRQPAGAPPPAPGAPEHPRGYYE